MNGGDHWHGSTLILNLLIQPNSANDQVVGIHAGALKVRITDVATGNKANQHLCRFIAGLCGVSKSKVKLESGQPHQNKRIRILLTDTHLPSKLCNY